MSCTTCGSSGRCGCSRQIVGVVMTQQPCSSGDCCQPVVQANPQPYYNCAPVCQEGHTQRITIQQFYADVKLLDTWNIPACGTTATINTDGLKAIVVGSYLWNPDYGYFEVTAFNSGTGQITVLNHCNDGNAAAGTNVPQCTEFTVTVPPADTIPTGTPCLAVDFTAPDVGDCIDITLSATTGLVVGYKVQIGSGIYRLSAIKPNDVVTICNDGEGITPGTPVIAFDSAGNYQYCLGIISVNPCDNDSVDEGSVVVCSDSLEKPLKADIWNEGLITVVGLEGGDDHTAHYFAIDADAKGCAVLTVQVNIVAGTSNYSFTVDNIPPQFQNTVVIYSGLSDLRFEITSIVGLVVNVTSLTVPVANDTLPVGAWVCTITCCEANFLDSLAMDSRTEQIVDDTPHVIDTTGGPTSYDTPHLTWSVTNGSTTHQMKQQSTFITTMLGLAAGDNLGGGPEYFTYENILKFTVNGGPTQAFDITNTITLLDDGDQGLPVSLQNTWLRNDILAPGATITYELWATINLPVVIGSGGSLEIDEIRLQAGQVGVPA